MQSYYAILVAFLVAVPAATAQTPAVTGVSPNSVSAGSGQFTITVSGINFPATATATWNNIPLGTAFQNSSTLMATVPGTFIAAPGTAYVGVTGAQGLVPVTILQASMSITTTALPTGAVGQAYTATLAVSGGASPYSWSVQTGTLPPGLSLSSGGLISGTPSTTGTFPFTVQVTDATRASAVASLSITISAPAFSITTASLPNGTVGQPYSQQFAASGGAQPYRWSGQNLPPGLSIDPATGVLSGTPTQAGPFSPTIQVTDSASPQNIATRTYTVTFAAAPVSIGTLSPLPSGTVGTVYSPVTLTASGGTPPYSWFITSGSVPGLTLDPNTGVLQGTPTSAGSFSITLRVADSAGQQATQTFSITINTATLTIVASPAPPNGTAGIAYPQQRFSVVGGTAPYTWSASGVPGLSIDPATGILSGTPTSAGPYTLLLQVTDSKGVTGNRSFPVTISAAPATLKLTSPNQLPDTTLGSPLSYTMTATGGTPPYTWSANGLPAGLNINPTTGVISGTLAAAGPITFVVVVRDAALAVAQDNFTINVLPPPLPAVTIAGLPDTADPLKQYPITVALASPYSSPVSGTVNLTSSPADSGPADNSIQFSSGGRSASFTIAQGDTKATLNLQVGTVAGTVNATINRVTVGGLDVTPAPAVAASTQIARAAPVITSATVTRSGSTLTVRVAGYATSREVTQATFNFSAASGQSLSASQFTIPVDSVFSPYFQDAGNAAFGSQFVFTQPFTIQGDASAVIPQSVTLVNRVGSTTATFAP